jgi:predicted nucleic acid-binding protein
MNAVDTNVFIYSIDQNEPIKRLKAENTLRQLRGTPTILLWQVLGEAVQRLRRWLDRGDLTDAEFKVHVTSIRTMFSVVVPSIHVLDYALDLVSRYSLSHWDSMLLGACRDAGVTTLYTEDMGSPRNIDGIQLVNPFI